MAKKKITGKTKLTAHITQDVSQENERRETIPDASQKQPEKLNLISRKIKVQPTSFRLTAEDKQRLKKITDAVNELSQHRKVSETLILKALINNASKTKPERVFSMVKDILL